MIEDVYLSTFLSVENVREINSHLYFCVYKACFNVAVVLFAIPIVNLFSTSANGEKCLLLQFQNYLQQIRKICYFKSAILPVPLREPEM